jgi:hypothetical protein
MQKHVLSVTPAGATGAATGSALVTLYGGAKIYGFYLDFAAVTSDTCVRLETIPDTSPVFVLTSSTADGWYFPRYAVCTSTGASYSSLATDLVQFPVIGSLACRVGSSTPTAAGVVAHVFMDEV